MSKGKEKVGKAKPTGYIAVEYQDFGGLVDGRDSVKEQLRTPQNWTLFKLRSSMQGVGYGADIMNTKMKFDDVQTSRGRVTATAFEWQGFPDWLISDERVLFSTKDTQTQMREAFREVDRVSKTTTPYDLVTERIAWATNVDRHNLFYKPAPSDSGRIRLRLTQKFVDKLVETSPKFTALREELHARGYAPREKSSFFPAMYEFWSLMFVYSGADNQKYPLNDKKPALECVSHADSDENSVYYTTIIPFTVDPPEAGGTVMTKGHCQAWPNTNSRLIETPINTYGYVLSFRSDVYHFGAANNTGAKSKTVPKTEAHTRIYLMQVLSDKPEDPNDKAQRRLG
jgi:hypothetical protein